MSENDVADYGKIAAGAPRDLKRRRVAQRVQAAREKLTSETGTKPAFDHELVLSFARNRISAAVFLPVLALTVAGVGQYFLEPLLIAGWLSLVLVANLVLLLAGKRYTKLQRPDAITVQRWRGRFVMLETFHGFTWSLIVVIPVIGIDPQLGALFLFVVSLMVVAAGAMLSASLPGAVWGGTLPITSALAVKLAIAGQHISIAFLVVALAVQGYFLLLAHRLFSAAIDGFAMRAEKETLIEELEIAKRASDEARQRAEAANIAKSRFLATMSHELRTPLNAILGFSEVMKAEILGPMPNATYKEYSTDIHASGQHLLNLINEILDLSRIEAGRFELNEEAVSLPYSVEDCVRLLGIRAKTKGIAVKEIFEEGMPTLWADERAVRQITLNLLSNAIKFTPTEGTIYVKVGWTAGGGQYLSVRDTGPGIPEDEIPVVLSSFGQGSNALKTAEQGAGLGLPIVRGLVDLHGGSFTFKSKLRVGTEVIIAFPPERVMQALPAVAVPAARAA